MKHEKKNSSLKLKMIKILKEPLLYLLIIIAIIQGIIYSNMPVYGETGDSDGYLHIYDSESIFKGYLSDSRPPVYSYFIKVIKKIGGEENLEINVVKAQKLLFFISIILFYCTIRLLTKKKIIICILTFIFGISPSIIIWNTFIITESIVGLEVLILAFITIKYLKNPSKILAGLMGIVILGMILTKPALIYLLPIYILFVILRFILNKEERKKLFFAIGSLLICGVVLILYCLQMKNLYGIFALTSVSNINNRLCVIYSGAYEEIRDNAIANEVSELVAEQPVTEGRTYEINGKITDTHSAEELKEFVELAVKTNTYKEYMLNRVIALGSENIGTAYPMGEPYDKEASQNLSSISRILIPITFGFIYIVILGSVIYLVWYLIKYKKINWISAFFTSTIFSGLFTLIVGAPFEPQRLFFPSMCLVILYVGVILDKIILKEEKLLNEKNIE